MTPHRARRLLVAVACALVGCAGETFVTVAQDAGTEAAVEAGPTEDASSETSLDAAVVVDAADGKVPFCTAAAAKQGLLFCDAFDLPEQVAAPFGFEVIGGFGVWSSQTAQVVSAPRAASVDLISTSLANNFGFLRKNLTSPKGASARFSVRFQEIGLGNTEVVSLSFVNTPEAGTGYYDVAIRIGPTAAALVERGTEGSLAVAPLARTIPIHTWTQVEVVVATSGITVKFDGKIVFGPQAPVDTAGSGLRTVRLGAVSRTATDRFGLQLDDVAVYAEP